jgi:Putative lumazine-binding
MKRLALLLLTVVSISVMTALLPTRAQNAEEAAVRQALDNYVQGHVTGQGEYFRKVFHPDSKLFAVRDGKYWQLTSEEYITRASGKPASDEAQRKRRIESVDITGNAAIAKIVLDYPQVKFTDYMSLLKINGQWWIVNKTFHSEPKPRP